MQEEQDPGRLQLDILDIEPTLCNYRFFHVSVNGDFSVIAMNILVLDYCDAERLFQSTAQPNR